MALRSLNYTVGAAINDGRSRITFKNGALPAPTLTTLLADITAALAVTAIAGDTDSTTAVTLVQTDANALVLAQQSDVSITFNTSTVTTKNQMRSVLRKALADLDSGYTALT